MNKLYIVGFGPGDKSLWTETARSIIENADRLISTARISESDRKIEHFSLSGLMSELNKPFSGTTVVLVSGDCGFFSAAKSILREFSEKYQIELINGISSVQYFCAKIGVSYDDAKIISMHGRSGQIAAYAAYNKKIFALTGGDIKAHDIIATLNKSGLKLKITVGERLSYPNERIISGNFENERFDDLCVMYIENPNAVNPHMPIPDEDFIRGDSPMTKEEIRQLSLFKLKISPSDVLYDIGAGTGSVAIEMARRAFEGYVYAIEMKDYACELIEQNRIKHGAYNLEVIQAKAPDGFSGLPAPTKAFIGGSMGSMSEILEELTEKSGNMRIVSNAVTLQGLNQIIEGYAEHGFTNIETICVNIAKSKKISDYDMMIAQNPVYIVAGERYE